MIEPTRALRWPFVFPVQPAPRPPHVSESRKHQLDSPLSMNKKRLELAERARLRRPSVRSDQRDLKRVTFGARGAHSPGKPARNERPGSSRTRSDPPAGTGLETLLARILSGLGLVAAA